MKLEELVANAADDPIVRAQLDFLAEAATTASGICIIGQGSVAPLRPILDDGGLRWCCTDDPPHCTVYVAARVQ